MLLLIERIMEAETCDDCNCEHWILVFRRIEERKNGSCYPEEGKGRNHHLAYFERGSSYVISDQSRQAFVSSVLRGILAIMNKRALFLPF